MSALLPHAWDKAWQSLGTAAPRLARVLDRERIYQTAALYAQFETDARRNLVAAV